MVSCVPSDENEWNFAKWKIELQEKVYAQTVGGSTGRIGE